MECLRTYRVLWCTLFVDVGTVCIVCNARKCTAVLVKPTRAELPRNSAFWRHSCSFHFTKIIHCAFNSTLSARVKLLKRKIRESPQVVLLFLPPIACSAPSTRGWKLARHVEVIASSQATHQCRTFETGPRTSTTAHPSRIPAHTRRGHRAKARSPVMARHLNRRNNDHELA
jgi:hypothetical protein